MNFLIKNFIYNFILVTIFWLFFFSFFHSFFLNYLSFYLSFNVAKMSFFFFFISYVYFGRLLILQTGNWRTITKHTHTMRRMVWIVKPLCKSHDIRIDTSCTARVTVSCLLSITKLLESLISNILILKIIYTYYICIRVTKNPKQLYYSSNDKFTSKNKY